MTVITNVSLLGQSTEQSDRLKDLRLLMDNLQRQVTTQKKSDNYSGLGSRDSLNIQRLRDTRALTQSYLDNVNTVSNRMNMMNKIMTQVITLGNETVKALQLQGQGSAAGLAVVKNLASNNLKFAQDLVNEKVDGRYLFAGADSTQAPFIGANALNSNFSNQITSWLAGGGVNNLITTTDGFNAAALGFSPALAASPVVTARIDQNLDVDYTVKADQAGFADIVRALGMLSNMKYPTPPGDVATTAEYETALDHITTVLTRGIQTLQTSAESLAGKFNLLKTVKDAHEQDLTTLSVQIDGVENVDTSTAIISLQQVQNQLTASYQVTKIVNGLSLINFM